MRKCFFVVLFASIFMSACDYSARRQEQAMAIQSIFSRYMDDIVGQNPTFLDEDTEAVLLVPCHEATSLTEGCQGDTEKWGYHDAYIENDILLRARDRYNFKIDPRFEEINWTGCVRARFKIHKGKVTELRSIIGTPEEFAQWFMDNDQVRDLVHEAPWSDEQRGQIIDKVEYLGIIPRTNCISSGILPGDYPTEEACDLWQTYRFSDLPDFE